MICFYFTISPPFPSIYNLHHPTVTENRLYTRMFCFARSEMKKKIAVGAGFISCELHHACIGPNTLFTRSPHNNANEWAGYFFNTDGHGKQSRFNT